MRSPNEARVYEKKDCGSFGKNYQADSKHVEGERKINVPRANEGLKRGMESRHIQVRLTF
jgi:hypothetical protein